MVPRRFEYYAPATVAEAALLLREHAGDAKVLAGGMSLIPLMKMRLASPGHIVDINRISDLEYIKESEDKKSLLLGSLARHHAIESSPLVRDRARLLAETASLIGDPQVRNLGTIGGSLAHSDPSGDWGAAIIAMRGSVSVVGPSGGRMVPVDEFLLDTFATALMEDEIITEVIVPFPPGRRSGGAYQKLERKAGDFATVAVAAQVSFDEKMVCTSAGIGLTALGPKNLRAVGAEEALLGREATDQVIEEAAAAAARECSPTDDPLRGSAKYKRQMAVVFTRRALRSAVQRARAGRGGKDK
ncbi:MAG: xanthine dehydrogenase family protein subunit M [Thaumarchaeota archaeon]|nr:xanthine dehydrogenase family protein subunit M [Nitrososphaerota archaeon]